MTKLFFFLFLLAPTMARAEATWYWRGIEIIGQRKIDRAEIQALVPLRIGAEFRAERERWNGWCAEIQRKFRLVAANCSAVRYSNFDAYFVIDVVEPGEEARATVRVIPPVHIPLATAEILEIYEKLYARLFELFSQGKPPRENADLGYLDFDDEEMHRMVLRLVKLVPPFRDNLLEVLERDGDLNQREKAANLLNWTVQNLGRTIFSASQLLDDPSTLVRNNISRFAFHYVDSLKDTEERHRVIDSLLLQLNRPSFEDRNKSLINLLFLALKFPADRAYIREQGLPLISYVAENSVLDNVGGTAKQLLEILGKE